MKTPWPDRRWLPDSLADASLLAACGGVDSDDDRDHDDIAVDTAGRLAIAEPNASTLRRHDLDSGSVEASHTLQNAPSAVLASPGGRHAVVLQRTQDLVQFVDGGIWQEDHGDHLHDHKQASLALASMLTGARRAHCDLQAGVRRFTDASIATGTTTATLDLDAPIHRPAEPVGDKLLAVARADDAPDTLPTHLVLHQRNGSGDTPVRELPTRCDGMHGRSSSGGSTLAGCLGGMQLVRHPTATTVSDFTPQGWATGRVRRAHGFDRSGQRFLSVDDQGTLIVAQRQAGGWADLARVSGAIPALPSAAPRPAIAANGARDELDITDPVARPMVVVNSSTGAVVTRRDPRDTPSAMAWLGTTR